MPPKKKPPKKKPVLKKRPVKRKPVKKKPVKSTRPKMEIQVHYPKGKEYLYPKSHSKYKPKVN
tara:strand:+ start:1902 stop:2090 length:189 start_codon:yes stop_codon:yes gene_type:complete